MIAALAFALVILTTKHKILESGYGDRSADEPSESGDAKQQSIIS